MIVYNHGICCLLPQLDVENGRAFQPFALEAGSWVPELLPRIGVGEEDFATRALVPALMALGHHKLNHLFSVQMAFKWRSNGVEMALKCR